MNKLDKKFLISLKWDEKRKLYMTKRINKNFNALELIGLLEEIQQDLINQIRDVAGPDSVTVKKVALFSKEAEDDRTVSPK